MPRSIPSSYLLARRMLRKTTAVIELIEVGLTTGTVARIANNPEHVTVGGVVYQASSFSVDGLAEEGDSSLPRLTIGLSNIGGYASAQLEAGGILGQTVTLWIVSETDLSALPSALSWSFRVLSATVNRRVATFECGVPASLARVPREVYELRRFPGILRRPAS